jgi:hypothetical protein
LLYEIGVLDAVVGDNINRVVGLTAKIEGYVHPMYFTMRGEIVHADERVISLLDTPHDKVYELPWHDISRVWVKP